MAGTFPMLSLNVPHSKVTEEEVNFETTREMKPREVRNFEI